MKPKTTRCRSCGSEIAKSANTCPYCGKKRHKGVYVACAVIGILTFFTILFILADSSDDRSSTADKKGNPAAVEEVQKPDPIAISAADLYTAYADNEVNADNLYKEQKVSVTGVISDIGKDLITDAPCVSLSTGDPYGFNSVQLFFPKTADENKKIAALQNGQTVTIVGTCTGIAVVNVQVSNCHIAE